MRHRIDLRTTAASLEQAHIFAVVHNNTDPVYHPLSIRSYDHDFMIYKYKVRRCWDPECQDWNGCPYVHTGEQTLRRNPRLHHYSPQPCPSFLFSGPFLDDPSCPRGSKCPFAHGCFEAGLHPNFYRTVECPFSVACTARICFYFHTECDRRNPFFEYRLFEPSFFPRHRPGAPFSFFQKQPSSHYRTGDVSQVEVKDFADMSDFDLESLIVELQDDMRISEGKVASDMSSRVSHQRLLLPPEPVVEYFKDSKELRTCISYEEDECKYSSEGGKCGDVQEEDEDQFTTEFLERCRERARKRRL